MNLSVTRSSGKFYWPKEFKGAPCANATGGGKDGGWRVEIATIEDLREFTKTYGKIVFSPDGIEIYDDYRE